MAAKGTTGAPTTVSEGLNTVAQALVQCMSAPDAGAHMQQLDQMLKMTIGLIQTKGQQGGGQPGGPGAPGAGGPPPGAGGPPPGAMAPGGPGGSAPAGLAGIMGGGGGPAGPGGPGRMSPSGASADDIRRLIASSASSGGGTTT
jgi:hypothetical protein